MEKRQAAGRWATQKHVGSSAFPLHVHCSLTADGFPGGVPADTSRVSFTKPSRTALPSHAAAPIPRGADTRSTLESTHCPFFLGYRWYRRQKRCRGHKRTQAYSIPSLTDVKRTNYCSLYRSLYVVRNESILAHGKMQCSCITEALSSYFKHNILVEWRVASWTW